MSYSICVVDDRIPLGKGAFVNAGKRISETTLQMLINETETQWSESVLKDLVEELIADEENWSVSAFMSPEILIKSMEEEYYLPEFIIYDWDYGKTSENSEDLLKTILEFSFSMVSIYTASDKKEVVQSIIDKDFALFKNRIILRIKSETNSSSQLLEKIKEYEVSNFAFKFSKDLRSLTHKTLESILIEFGKPDIKEITWLFGDEDGSQNKNLNVKNLSEMIVEKLRNELISSNFGSEQPTIDHNYTPKATIELVKTMWSYRLYYKPKDNIVRKGDIIKKKNGDRKTLFLVLSSDCHLKNFWSKNFGFLALVPLHEINKLNTDLLKKLDLYKKKNDLKKLNLNPSSLTNFRPFEGPTVIPSIPIDDKYINFLLFPKEIFSYEILLPENKPDNYRKAELLYDYISEYEQHQRLTISEPFITPLVEHILYHISGYGVPDYPSTLQIEITENFKGIFE